MKIFKYPVSLGDKHVEINGDNGRFIHFGQDGTGHLCIWAEVHSHLKLAPVKIAIIPTGAEVPTWGTHSGTCVDKAGYVWHLYRIGGGG